MSFQLPAGMRPAQPPQGNGGGGGGGGGGNGQGGGNDEERAARQAQQEEMKRTMIQAMLEPAARERRKSSLLIDLLAAQVEDLLVRMGQQGQIRGQVTDEALKGLLEQVSAPPKPAAKPAHTSARTRTLGGGITIQRKNDDSDSDEYDL